MTRYINKADVVAEIERLREEEYPCDTFEESTGYYNALDEIATFLNTLEVKEVNDAYKQGYNDAIDKACDAYCRLCDTKECGDTGECEWVEKFRKRLMRQQ